MDGQVSPALKAAWVSPTAAAVKVCQGSPALKAVWSAPPPAVVIAGDGSPAVDAVWGAPQYEVVLVGSGFLSLFDVQRMIGRGMILPGDPHL